MNLDGKVAIMTGSGQGIGRAVAEDMASKGASVIINDIDENEAQTTAKAIKKDGGKVDYFVGNVAKPEDAQGLVDKALDRFGDVDILVNNAAITEPAMIHKMSDEQWDRVIDIDLKGVFNCIRAVTPTFKDKGKENPDAFSNGKIINITSVAGLTGTIGQINYSAAKAGVVGITMSAARELGRYRVQSNAVAFGIVETRMTEVIRGEKFVDKYKEKIVLNRFARKEDVVPGVTFLASEGSDYMTGHVMNISGGYHIGS